MTPAETRTMNDDHKEQLVVVAAVVVVMLGLIVFMYFGRG